MNDLEVIQNSNVKTLEDLLNSINLSQVAEDYQNLRKLVMFNTEFCMNIVKDIKSELDSFGLDAKLVDSLTSLINTSNNSVKLLTESYKKLIEVIEIYKSMRPAESKDSNTETISTRDIIERLKSNS
jgi:hypothetical protein